MEIKYQTPIFWFRSSSVGVSLCSAKAPFRIKRITSIPIPNCELHVHLVVIAIATVALYTYVYAVQDFHQMQYCLFCVGAVFSYSRHGLAPTYMLCHSIHMNSFYSFIFLFFIFCWIKFKRHIINNNSRSLVCYSQQWQ